MEKFVRQKKEEKGEAILRACGESESGLSKGEADWRNVEVESGSPKSKDGGGRGKDGVYSCGHGELLKLLGRVC